MNETFEKTAEQMVAFQKLWGETFTRIMQAAFTVEPNGPPPEVLKQIRNGILQALAQSWEEFMRSPQFLDGMKQWMDSAIQFRKMSNDFVAKVRNDLQAPSRDDLDNIVMAVRHLETNLRAKVDDLATQVGEIKTRLNGGVHPKARGAAKLQTRPRKRVKTVRKTAARKEGA